MSSKAKRGSQHVDRKVIVKTFFEASEELVSQVFGYLENWQAIRAKSEPQDHPRCR